MEVVRHHFRPEFLNRVDEIAQVGVSCEVLCSEVWWLPDKTCISS